MQQITLDIQTRAVHGTSAAGVLRDKGIVPAVIYGGNEPAVNVQIARKDLDRVMRSHNIESTLFKVNMGKDLILQVKSVQVNPVSDIVDHVDFMRVFMDREITLNVPIVILGTAIGLKKPGATLDIKLHELEVHCLPKDIPEKIEVDVMNLDTHNTIHVKDLNLSAGVKTKKDPETAVVAISFSIGEDAVKSEEAPAELEVLKEKPKADAAGAAGAAKPAAGAKPADDKAKKA